MSISWGNWDVRVYVADAWVSLARRFVLEHPVIVDHLDAILNDPVPAVRLQVAQNLHVIYVAAPDRMWRLGERIVTQETDAQILVAYLNHSMWHFCHSEPDRCEAVLTILHGRLVFDLAGNHNGHNLLMESLGAWAAQLYAAQGRELTRTWINEWAVDPEIYGDALNFIASSLRSPFFRRYAHDVGLDACAMCSRAQECLALILIHATRISAEEYSVLRSDAAEPEKRIAGQKYVAAEKVISHAMNQLYFGSGANADNREVVTGLPDAAAMARFLTDYADILALLSSTREPATLHYLIELYEFLMPGNPVTVFDAIYSILLGRGKEEGYHYESLGNTAVVSIVRRYIADYRGIFDDEGRRDRLVEILRLFSEVGWIDALKLLYDLPDILR